MHRGTWRLLAGTGLATVLLLAGTARMGWAQALSDFNWEGFQKRTGAEGVETQVHASPFSSGVSTVETLSVDELQLSGIVYASPSDSYALISGYVVRPGDLIAGYRVEAIERDKVKLDRVGKKFVLVLGGGL
jgi:hypothetical protein